MENSELGDGELQLLFPLGEKIPVATNRNQLTDMIQMPNRVCSVDGQFSFFPSIFLSITGYMNKFTSDMTFTKGVCVCACACESLCIPPVLYRARWY
jgi:hypothetical protein